MRGLAGSKVAGFMRVEDGVTRLADGINANKGLAQAARFDGDECRLPDRPCIKHASQY